MKTIAIYCGSKMPIDPSYIKKTRELAKFLAQNDIKIIYGGADIGLMRILANEALHHGGKVLGIMPENLLKTEMLNPNLTEFKIVKDMHERKALIESLADGFIALPGGFETLDEIFEIITWKYIGLHNKTAIFYNMNGYYDDIENFINKSENLGYLQSSFVSFATNLDDIDKAFNIIEK